MTLPVFEFLRRFLQDVLPRGLHRIRHDGFLSRCSKVDLDDVRMAILESLQDVEPDLELAAWTVPSLRPASHSDEDDTLRCPTNKPVLCKEQPGLIEQKIRTRIREFLIHWCFSHNRSST
jgi:hypothetical protein